MAHAANLRLRSGPRLFKHDGFHATSLDLIADEAGCTKGAVYSNFDGKEDLLLAVYERRVAARVAELEAITRETVSPAGAGEPQPSTASPWRAPAPVDPVDGPQVASRSRPAAHGLGGR